MIKYAFLDVADADVGVAGAGAAAAVEFYWSRWRLAQFFGSVIYSWLQLLG